MTNLSAFPVSVDGVRLDTYAMAVESSALTLGGLRTRDLVMPGLDGEVASLDDPREPSWFTMTIFVKGCDDDGALTPGTDANTVYLKNLQALKHLVGRVGSLLSVRWVVDPAATPATDLLADCKVVDAITPDDGWSAYGRVTVSLKIPGVYRRAVASTDWTTGASLAGKPIWDTPPLLGYTAPCDDAILLLRGPSAAGTKIVDVATGNYVVLNTTLADATQYWRVDVGQWSSTKGTAATLDTPGGVDVRGSTDWSGRTPVWLRLHPRANGGTYKSQVKVDYAGAIVPTSLSIRARGGHL